MTWDRRFAPAVVPGDLAACECPSLTKVSTLLQTFSLWGLSITAAARIELHQWSLEKVRSKRPACSHSSHGDHEDFPAPCLQRMCNGLLLRSCWGLTSQNSDTIHVDLMFGLDIMMALWFIVLCHSEIFSRFCPGEDYFPVMYFLLKLMNSVIPLITPAASLHLAACSVDTTCSPSLAWV